MVFNTHDILMGLGGGLLIGSGAAMFLLFVGRIAGISGIASAFLGPNGDTADPLASPLRGDLSGLPPMLIQVGDHEVLLSDSEALAKSAADAGVDVTLRVWPEMIHVWHSLAGMCEEADAAVTEAAAFINAHLGA